VVLKPLSAALKEKDHIFGVIVGTAANQNVNLSHITVPNSGSQVKLYQDVMNQAGVTPDLVTYVEAHGTGKYLVQLVIILPVSANDDGQVPESVTRLNIVVFEMLLEGPPETVSSALALSKGTLATLKPRLVLLGL
jgi:hypothetical protein